MEAANSGWNLMMASLVGSEAEILPSAIIWSRAWAINSPDVRPLITSFTPA